MKFSGTGMQSHFQQGYRRLAASEYIHYDDIGLFQMLKFPIHLILHFPAGTAVPRTPSWVVQYIPAFFSGKIFFQLRLPVHTVSHVDSPGKKDFRKTAVFFHRKFFTGFQLISNGILRSAGKEADHGQCAKHGKKYFLHIQIIYSRNICKNKQLQKHKKRPSVKIRTAAINIFLSKFLLFFFRRKFRFHISDNEVNPAFLS